MAEHLMLDLETLGADSAPNCVVLSIGAVLFNPEREDRFDDLTAEGFHVYLDPKPQLDVGIGVDWSTLLWWHQQSAPARTEMWNERLARVSPVMALGALKEYLKGKDAKRVWGNGPSFDCALLDNLCRTFGVTPLFKYFDQRCVRTVGELANLKRENFGTFHNALDDAASQAVYVQRCYKKLRG